MKTLIVYFSAEANTTKRIASKLAEETGYDIFEIRPVKPYTRADLNYMNPLSRCNREKIGNKDVPFEGNISDFESYEKILIGFPIWYGGTPNIVNTFCRSHDWKGRFTPLRQAAAVPSAEQRKNSDRLWAAQIQWKRNLCIQQKK